MALYDGAHYDEALEEFVLVGRAPVPLLRFTGLVWQGHVLDLLGRRADGLARYHAALDVPGSPTMRHDQYNLVIDKTWVAQRLMTPFKV